MNSVLGKYPKAGNRVTLTDGYILVADQFKKLIALSLKDFQSNEKMVDDGDQSDCANPITQQVAISIHGV